MSAPHEARRGEEARDLVWTYHYLERPCDKYPNGRYLRLAGGHHIFEPADYPCERDEPVLQWLPYLKRRHRDRPMGMGEMMVDVQRTYNRTIAQIVAYKNLVLNPQVMAPVGSLRQQLDDTPGAVWQYRPIAGMKPEWREMPDLPVGLFKVLDQCISDWQEITGQHQLPAGIESGSAISAINERDQSRRGVVVGRLADWYARLGIRFIELMRQHYTEERLLVVTGRFGTQTVPAFRGAQLKGIAQVHVNAGSVEPHTRAAQEGLIMNLVDRGLVDPQKAIQALQAGTAEAIVDAYQLDVAKQDREISQLMEMGRLEGKGVPMVDEDVDNHAVHLERLGMWMKTSDFEAQHEMVQEAARTHAQWHREMQMAEMLQQQMLQAGAAEQMGMENAAAPQASGGGAKPEPSKPSVESGTRAAQGMPKTSG